MYLQFLKARNLNSDGFKIALDLLVKAQIAPNAIAEVPFSFGVRAEGESKLTGKVMIKYLEQLADVNSLIYRGRRRIRSEWILHCLRSLNLRP